ncbi:flagellar brake domain-containing protein [Bacillus gobiensis]|uniref:flagellar brake protein n=1 Tax=Bacillus gobiensis TaxID=1441095 RepID=UPI003D1DFDF9
MLVVGDVLLLESYDSENPRPHILKCKVAKITEKELHITYPIDQVTGRSKFLINGTDLVVTFVTKEQIPYQFTCKVIGRLKEEIPMISLSYPSLEELEKIQRRQFLRVDALLDIAAYPGNPEKKPFTTITAKISAGGLSMIIPEEYRFDLDEQVDVHINLPIDQEKRRLVSATSRVKRLQWDEKNKKRTLSVEFSDISEDHQQLLMKYCFHHQIELNLKGLAE